jgi:hypothetical protein
MTPAGKAAPESSAAVGHTVALVPVPGLRDHSHISSRRLSDQRQRPEKWPSIDQKRASSQEENGHYLRQGKQR